MPKKEDLTPARNMVMVAFAKIMEEIVYDLYARIEKLEEHIKDK